ncbi:MAG: large-conductance mechanosensitive channel protein MscL [Steroidobacteraceae bacterium]|jgi:large conductance mechanosensitive channel
MSIASEFKEFAMKGNVVDMAVGVIVGAAFGKIVSSLVGDVIMPALGKLTGGVNFSDLAVTLGKDPTGKDVLIKYGSFVQTIFDFILIALVLFFALKGINRLKKPPAHAPDAPPPEPPAQEKLLIEIRDLLRRRP